MSMPTTRPSGTRLARTRESQPAPQPTSRILSVGSICISPSAGLAMGQWSCSIESPLPAAAQAKIIAIIHPITVQPSRRFRIKMPVKSRFLWPMIEGRKYNSVTESRNIIAPLLPLCITIQAANLFHPSRRSPSYQRCVRESVPTGLAGLRFRDFREELGESLLAVLFNEPLVDF